MFVMLHSPPSIIKRANYCALRPITPSSEGQRLLASSISCQKNRRAQSGNITKTENREGEGEDEETCQFGGILGRQKYEYVVYVIKWPTHCDLFAV